MIDKGVEYGVDATTASPDRSKCYLQQSGRELPAIDIQVSPSLDDKDSQDAWVARRRLQEEREAVGLTNLALRIAILKESSARSEHK